MIDTVLNLRDPQTGLATITVTYNPELELLQRQLHRIPNGVMKIIVDNGSVNQSEIVGLYGDEANVTLLLNTGNLGLAEALNRGVGHASSIEGIEHILLLDQDSEPAEGAVEKLFSALRSLENKIGLCAVGPRMMDVVTGMHHGFHVMTRWRWNRVYPRPDSAPIACANINGSGIMTSIAAWAKSGGMDAGLFIDHVDTDWSFRMLSKGMPLFGIADVDFIHRMGLGSRRIWLFGWHVLPERSPLRHYYLYRNTLRLMRRDYVPAVWKAWASVKMAVTISIILLFGPDRLKQMSSIAKGLRDGFL